MITTRPGAGTLARGAILVVLAALVAWLVAGRIEDRQADERRQQAMTIAKAQVTDLTSLSAGSVDAALKRMSRRTSGEFKRQLDGITQSFATTVAKDGIDAKGRVASAGIESIDGRDAEILVAANTAVTTKKSTKPTTRSYRIRVTLSRDDGAWLISGMEFVA